MDELAKTEARNYLSAAGFFMIASWFILFLFMKIGSTSHVETTDIIHTVLGIGLLIIATLLIVLHKRDMISILFFLMGFLHLFSAFCQPGTWNLIMSGFLVLVVLVVLTAKDRVKWLVFLIPLIMFVQSVIKECGGDTDGIPTIVCYSILAVLSLYYAFCCASERCTLPGSKLLTADESTDFKASGSVLGYMLFALMTGGYALYYILSEAVLPLETFVMIELIAGVLMIFVAILLFAVAKMRFTPIMFLLMGLTSILSICSSGAMFIGIGIMLIIIGLFAMLRKESRILPGIMLILHGCSAYVYINGTVVIAPVVSIILNAIPCLIAIYLSFVVYSQGKLPKF